MTDLIDRQAAINEVARWKGCLDDDMILRMLIGLNRLPSAQPEILACGQGELVQAGSSDLISRQAAIDAIKKWGLIDGLSEGQAIEILADEEKLPPAQPTPCEVCRHNPPSSMDGKPCCVCPAERRTDD